jgi:MYXO-CTERM domain-containing protein
MPARLGRALFVASLAPLLACGDQTPLVSEDLGEISDEILGGQVDNTDKGVVGIVHVTGGGFGQCSGSLLSENVVLTALHCVAPTPQQIDCPNANAGPAYAANEFYVTTDTTISEQGSFHEVREVVTPPGSGFCGRDVSILILNQLASSGEATPYAPRDVPLVANEVYDAAGYGEQGEGGPSGTRMRRNELFVLCVGANCGAPEFVYNEEWVGDIGVCSGDSGGPAIDAQNRVTGVASRGAPGCEQPLYGDVYSHLQWIKDTTVYAAGLAGIAPPPWVDGGSGGTGGTGQGGAGAEGGGGPGPGAGGSTGDGWVAGDTPNHKSKGTIVSSCSYGHGDASYGWLAALALAGVAASRRRRGDTPRPERRA